MSDGMVYTYERYEELLRRLQLSDNEFTGYGDEYDDQVVILRHDVDWSPRKAERMAEIEANLGVRSSYFFLVTSPFYNPFHEETRDAISSISDLGHDVGLHFSTHQYWSAEPPSDVLSAAVQREHRLLSELVDDLVSAVSFHIPPDWVLGRAFDSFVSTYEPLYFNEFAYRGDSNQRWRDQSPLSDGIPSRLQMLVHPGLWGEEDASFTDRLDSERERRFDMLAHFLHEQFVEPVTATPEPAADQ